MSLTNLEQRAVLRDSDLDVIDDFIEGQQHSLTPYHRLQYMIINPRVI
jgi:hypothetical protein